jgi:hypothetical protein
MAMIVVWAGLLSAIVGLVQGLRSRGRSAALFALTGLLLNSGVLASALGDVSPLIRAVAGRSGGATLVQLNSMPQVFENSVTIFDSKYGFRLELPAGFVKNPSPAPAAMVVHSYIRYADDGSPNIGVNIDRLKGILAPRKGKPSVEELKEFKRGMQKSAPYAVLVRVEQEQWKSHTLDVFLVDMPYQGEMMSLWSVQVPLAGEAIQIHVGGLKEAEDQYRKVLTHILKSLQGNSNWD